MKILLSLLLSIMLCGTAHAQNYQCVLTNKVNFFTNSNHYLRAIRIDSVKTIGGNTVLYPFKTARGEYSQCYLSGVPKNQTRGGSWLGGQITILPDGTHWFDNYRGDTVIIKSQAQLNDSWVFYNDTGSVYYQATIISVDTMTVMNSLDSVKTILLTSMDSNGVISVLNNREIVMSKNHGFVKAFALHMFPFPSGQLSSSGGFDYFEFIGGGNFTLLDFYQPTTADIYDFSIGDVFQKKAYFSYNSIEATVSDSIVDKQINSSLEFDYTIRRIIKREPIGTPPPSTIPTIITTSITGSVNTPLLNLTFLPEEWGMYYTIHYNPSDSNFCVVGRSYRLEPSHVTYNTNVATACGLVPCRGPVYEYKIGFGEVMSTNCSGQSSGNPYKVLTYSRKIGVACGQYEHLDIGNVPLKEDANIYPNPASDNITIETPGTSQPLQLMIYDLAGKIMYDGHTGGNRTQVSVKGFTNGYYLLRLIAPDGSQSNHKVIVQH